MSELCIICLINNNNLRIITETGLNTEKIVNSLEKLVPEVDWSNDCCICQDCLVKLEIVYQFRELCLKSFVTRQNLEKLKSEKMQDYQPEEQQIKIKFIRIKNETYKKNKRTTKYKKLICPNCSKIVSNRSSLSNHLKACGVEKKIKHNDGNICDVCGTTFNNKYLLKRHSRNVHATEKNYKCDLCDRKFASSIYLNAHKIYHSGERKHICSFCGKGYITASDLYHHEKIHFNKRAYRCDQCPKAFNTSSDLHKHKICVHMDRSQWKYECTFCQRRFPLKTNLDTHVKTHTGERNFLCHLCDRKCINKSVLKRHIDSHSNVKAYKCELCLVGYKYQKSLNLHLMKVHGLGDAKLPEKVKKFPCNFCPKAYFANNKLQRHIRTHMGIRFPCQACDKTFVDESYMKHHYRTAHAQMQDDAQLF